MKMGGGRKRKGLASVEGLCASLLHEYAKDGSETSLRQGYELGRRALTERKSLVELASIHHQALQGLLREEIDEKRQTFLLRVGSDFLAECLSPYEMAQRGFQDAVTALRQLNETLEEEIKPIPYPVHHQARHLLFAGHLALAEVARELPQAQRERIGRFAGVLSQVEKH